MRRRLAEHQSRDGLPGQHHLLERSVLRVLSEQPVQGQLGCQQRPHPEHPGRDLPQFTQFRGIAEGEQQRDDREECERMHHLPWPTQGEP